jgi:hypothetical protein
LSLLGAVRTSVADTTHVALVVVVDHIMSSCTAPDDAFLKWTLAKRKMIVPKYGTLGGSSSAHAALVSDVPADDVGSLPTLEDCTD